MAMYLELNPKNPPVLLTAHHLKMILTDNKTNYVSSDSNFLDSLHMKKMKIKPSTYSLDYILNRLKSLETRENYNIINSISLLDYKYLVSIIYLMLSDSINNDELIKLMKDTDIKKRKNKILYDLELSNENNILNGFFNSFTVSDNNLILSNKNKKEMFNLLSDTGWEFFKGFPKTIDLHDNDFEYKFYTENTDKYPYLTQLYNLYANKNANFNYEKAKLNNYKTYFTNITWSFKNKVYMPYLDVERIFYQESYFGPFRSHCIKTRIKSADGSIDSSSSKCYLPEYDYSPLYSDTEDMYLESEEITTYDNPNNWLFGKDKIAYKKETYYKHMKDIDDILTLDINYFINDFINKHLLYNLNSDIDTLYSSTPSNFIRDSLTSTFIKANKERKELGDGKDKDRIFKVFGTVVKSSDNNINNINLLKHIEGYINIPDYKVSPQALDITGEFRAIEGTEYSTDNYYPKKEFDFNTEFDIKSFNFGSSEYNTSTSEIDKKINDSLGNMFLNIVNNIKKYTELGFIKNYSDNILLTSENLKFLSKLTNISFSMSNNYMNNINSTEYNILNVLRSELYSSEFRFSDYDLNYKIKEVISSFKNKFYDKFLSKYISGYTADIEDIDSEFYRFMLYNSLNQYLDFINNDEIKVTEFVPKRSEYIDKLMKIIYIITSYYYRLISLSDKIKKGFIKSDEVNLSFNMSKEDLINDIMENTSMYNNNDEFLSSNLIDIGKLIYALKEKYYDLGGDANEK